MLAVLRPSPQQDVLTFDPHPHELHAVVQRRLSAEQKQEVLLLRQHHGGQLEEKKRYLPLNASSAFIQWMFSSLSRLHLNIRNVWGLKGYRTCSRCRRPSAAALWADVILSLSRLMSSSVISSLWEWHTLQLSPWFNSDLTEWQMISTQKISLSNQQVYIYDSISLCCPLVEVFNKTLSENLRMNIHLS